MLTPPASFLYLFRREKFFSPFACKGRGDFVSLTRQSADTMDDKHKWIEQNGLSGLNNQSSQSNPNNPKTPSCQK